MGLFWGGRTFLCCFSALGLSLGVCQVCSPRALLLGFDLGGAALLLGFDLGGAALLLGLLQGEQPVDHLLEEHVVFGR